MTEYIVSAPNGKPVALRSSPVVTDANVIVRLPVMTRVQADPDTGIGWQKVEYNAVTGYMMSSFLVPLVPAETIHAAEQQAFQNLGITPQEQDKTIDKEEIKEQLLKMIDTIEEMIVKLGGVG